MQIIIVLTLSLALPNFFASFFYSFEVGIADIISSFKKYFYLLKIDSFKPKWVD